MRVFFGLCVLIGGVLALGGWAMVIKAPSIEQRVAQAVAETADLMEVEAVAANVSGRDVTILGQVPVASDVANLRAAFDDVPGVRRVDVSGVTLLPVASPFEARLSYAQGSQLQAQGVLPSETVRAAFMINGTNPLEGLSLAAGVPDEDWGRVLMLAEQVIRNVNGGVAVLSDRTLTLTGAVDTPDDHNVALEFLADIPSTYSIQDGITIRDDGAPLRLHVILSSGRALIEGKVPSVFPEAALTSPFSGGGQANVAVSVLSPPEGWMDMVDVGLSALALLIEGELTVEDQSMVLTGLGSPDALAQVETLLGGAALAPGYDAVTDLAVFGADVPLSLRLVWTGDAASATGQLPAGFEPLAPFGAPVINEAETLFLPDTDGAFTANARAGVAGLELLVEGTMNVTATEIMLSGVARSPRVADAVNTALDARAQNTDTSLDLTYLDDGSPAVWTLRFGAGIGAEVQGRLPTALNTDELATALRLLEVVGTPDTAVEDDDPGVALDVLAAVAPLLSEVEEMMFNAAEGTAALEIVVSPGVNIDLVAATLAERLDSGVAFSVGPLADLPVDGARRVHAASGLEQQFQNGYWLPVTVFDPDADTCAAQTDGVLARLQVTFLPGGIELDGTANRALDALTAVVLACVEAGLTLEVVGHTDTSGNAFDNEALSLDRAQVVLDELSARGVPTEAMVAFGVGGAEPVASNDSAEGRAANRRTDIIWFAPGDLREP